MEDDLVRALRDAIAANPSDVTLRLHLAEHLGQSSPQEAVQLAATVLSLDPTNERARAILGMAPAAGSSSDSEAADPAEFNWEAAESEVEHIAPPMFVSAEPAAPESAFRVESSTLTLADVGGMVSVKKRLNAAFLAPLRNPELQRLYGKSLRGGLLMYGPPGCGKTFIARAIAGELGAKFLAASVADVLDPYVGQSEQNVHELFQLARREAPCVLFLDEIDTLGQRRTATQNNALRGTVNQLLTEMDGIDSVNEGVFILAATNQPWEVDAAMRRPGRLDRTILVLPPDQDAREAIFRYHLSRRPVENISTSELAKRTDGLSGADIAYVCEVASEIALTDSVESGIARMIGMPDLIAALGEVRPSIAAWLDTARTVATYGDDDGTHAELRAYLKKVKRL
jgi:SpoVK/Ycf46/Vps4 family AAA+-type ATPase